MRLLQEAARRQDAQGHDGSRIKRKQEGSTEDNVNVTTIKCAKGKKSLRVKEKRVCARVEHSMENSVMGVCPGCDTLVFLKRSPPSKFRASYFQMLPYALL
jgi:hypothetical protein